ncbi:MAG: hypothetical protein HUN04_08480 [Desulfobacter sp.]|nr:MAG: hypothetical protein HUN04_08480 [Desulfobacter sp.]
MCYTTWDDASGVKQPGVPMPSFFKVLEKNGWDNIAHIGMSGGEPLLTGEFGFALEYFSRHRINTVILEVTTNGILLNQFFDSLERCNLRKMRFTISVDGVGRAYEEIRKGASWERLNENLALLSELVGGRAGWDVEIHSLVMRSTLSHMEDVVSLADEYGFELVFNSITGIENIDENIFAFPSLVDNLPWDDYFDAALGRARECGFHRACQNLEDCRVLLGRRVRGVSNAMHRADWNVLSRWDRYVSKEIGTRPCVIAGFSEQSFGFLELNQKFDIRGVADFKPTPKVLGRFGGVSVYPLEKLGNLARDIVLDTQTYNQNHRVDLIRKMYPHHQVHLIDLFDQNTYETINTLVSLLADRSIVLFGAGGTGRLLYSQTKLGQLNVKAFADNNKQKQTRGCCGLPVIPAEAIFDIAKDVIILSPRFFNQISQQLNGLFGDKIRVYNLF